MKLNKTQRALALALVIAAAGAGLAVAQTSSEALEPLVLPNLPDLQALPLGPAIQPAKAP